MRVFGMQIWPVKVYSLFWWVLFLPLVVYVLLALLSCRDTTGSGTEMRRVPTDAEYTANLKKYGVSYNQGMICGQPSGGTVADVQVCFAQLWQAMAITGSATVTCGSAIAATRTVWAAIQAGSICSIGLFATYEGLERWVEATQVGRWANQSSEEIINRFRQVIYERMVREGKWTENAGCC